MIRLVLPAALLLVACSASSSVLEVRSTGDGATRPRRPGTCPYPTGSRVNGIQSTGTGRTRGAAETYGILDTAWTGVARPELATKPEPIAALEKISKTRNDEIRAAFAVVATEVRKLAERAQKAAREIGEQAGSSVEVAERSGRLIGELLPTIRKTSDLVQEVSAASVEQSAGVTQVSKAMGTVDQVTHATRRPRRSSPRRRRRWPPRPRASSS